MLGGRSSEQWIAQYASSHQNPVNRICHTLGIPLIVVSLGIAVAAVFLRQAARVLKRLAIPPRRRALVDG